MTSLVILAGYSATLTSSLAVERRHLPFRDLQGLLNDGSYKLSVVDNTSSIDIFKVRSTYNSDFWLLQLHDLQLNGRIITRFDFIKYLLCVLQIMCIYGCLYVCLYVFFYIFIGMLHYISD